MSEEEFKEQLLLRINEVLHYIWDPIGISDTPEARDEYDSYASNVWQAVLEGKPENEISEMLTTITTKLMGLEPRREHDVVVANIVIDWARYLKERQQ